MTTFELLVVFLLIFIGVSLIENGDDDMTTTFRWLGNIGIAGLIFATILGVLGIVEV